MYIFVGIIVVIIGIFNIIYPKDRWDREFGRHVKDSEPTERALISNRILGVVIVIVGIAFMFIK
jgi:uncharacterized protein YjeT (DUF2065 family)